MLSKAAQGFMPRRTLGTSQALNPRRTQLSEKRTISESEILFVYFENVNPLRYFKAEQFVIQVHTEF